MRIRAIEVVGAIALVALAAAACSGGLFRQYEYEEEMYLSLDGTATLYVNSSLAALNALRGTSFDTSPRSGVDRSAIRAYFATPHTRVVSVKTSRRSSRDFVHLRIDVDDVRHLAEAAPFSWSRYAFRKDDDLFKYVQTIGASARKDVGPVGWNGREVVAFRMHLPSKIAYHNTGRRPGRGNILTWEQSLADRLRSVPLDLDARMETESILFRTLWLFGLTFVAVVVSFALVIWWVLHRAPRAAPGAEARGAASGDGASAA